MKNNLTNNKMRTSITVVLISVFLFFSSANQAQEVPKIPFYLPIHSSQLNDTVVKLNDELLETGFNFEIKHSDLWQQYQQDIRSGKPGIYFAPPHFTAWLIQQKGFIPLLRVKDKLRYVIASKTNDQDIFEISDLVDRKICTQNPLNLDYLLIKYAFRRNIQTADTHLVNSVFDEINSTDTPCSAFSISNHIFEQQELKNSGKYIRLAQSNEWNNYAFTMHPSLTEEFLAPLLQLLNEQKTQEILAPLLTLTGQEALLIDATSNDYPIEYLEELEEYWGEE